MCPINDYLTVTHNLTSDYVRGMCPINDYLTVTHNLTSDYVRGMCPINPYPQSWQTQQISGRKFGKNAPPRMRKFLASERKFLG